MTERRMMEENDGRAGGTPTTAGNPKVDPRFREDDNPKSEIRKEYRLEDGTVLWQGPLKLGQVLEIAKRVSGLDVQGILSGEKMADLLSIVLEPPEVVKGLNLAEAITADAALEMVDDFFQLNPRTAQLLSGLSSAIPLWFARAAAGENGSTGLNLSSGLPISSAEGTSANGSGS